jgi:SAM-dependent methyltransferase
MTFTTALKIIKLTQNSYSQIADSFADSRFSSWTEIDAAIKKYVQPGAKILDLGCGSGRLLKSLSKIFNLSYLGLDNCNRLIEKAQKNLQTLKNNKLKASFVCHDILNLADLPEDSFNVIFMVASFHHLPSAELRQKVMANLFRLLKSNGVLIMTNWNLWQPGAKKSIWHNKLKHNYQLKNDLHSLGFKDVITLWQNKSPLYYYAFTLRELRQLFRAANFQILENYYVRRGQKARWWNGYNILTVGKK